MHAIGLLPAGSHRVYKSRTPILTDSSALRQSCQTERGSSGRCTWDACAHLHGVVALGDAAKLEPSRPDDLVGKRQAGGTKAQAKLALAEEFSR